MTKHVSIVTLILVLFFATSLASAADFRLPRFLPGDTVSSDYFNDIMKKIEGVRKTVVSADLVGTWECISYVSGAVCDGSYEASGWEVDSESLYCSLNSTFTFSDDGDGTFSLATTLPDPFQANRTDAVSSPYKIIDNMFFFNKGHRYEVQRINNTRIKLSYTDGLASVSIIMCNKQSVPPLPPSDLTATAAGTTISLSWADNSTDETGFKIFRKDSVKGEWNEVGSVGADTTSYSDTVSFGTYWYRIFATNDNGDSVGSNVIKITIQ